MSARWLFHGVFTGAELDKVDERLDALEGRARAVENDLDQEVAALRNDVRRLELVNRALLDVCLERGLVSHEAFKAKLSSIGANDAPRGAH
ncbi:MAG: hypothetical protein IT454_15560 [Planctomycetes bacterium]|nr:hypothetical protein [Planctomycetota bacterium]